MASAIARPTDAPSSRDAPAGTRDSDVASSDENVDSRPGYNSVSIRLAALAAAASDDAPPGEGTRAYRNDDAPLTEFTASYIAAATIAMFRLASGGGSPDTPIVSSIAAFHSSA